MPRRMLRAAAVLLVASLALSLKRRLGRPSSGPREIRFLYPMETGSLAGAGDAAFFYHIMMVPRQVRERFFEGWGQAVAYQEPHVRLPFTPLLCCEPGYSVLMDRFDWQVVPETAYKNATHVGGCRPIDGQPWRSDTVQKADPWTVWVAPHGLPRLLQLAEARLDGRRRDRVVVFSGTEVPLSQAFGASPAERSATIARLRRYFGRIVYQIKDIELEHVSAAPMGFGWGYALKYLGLLCKGAYPATRNRIAHAFLELEDLFTVANASAKTRAVLATGGVTATWLEDPALPALVRRFRRQGVGFPPSNSSLEVVSDSFKSRRQMRAWARSSAARAAGVEFRIVPSTEWWQELSTYRFLLSPIGSAIQTAKTVEALLVLTVPIIQRMGYALHDELIDMGFPIVLVEEWPEVTSAAVEGWWRATSPRLESFRRNCLTVDSYWRMFVGELRRCT
mmetsp:Transcript_23079/g.73077  ORF Transcript_23079/g.73077 Transcript_23079/m.73077 type:complete len:450 (+) Transcript_23079:207-1556(+)